MIKPIAGTVSARFIAGVLLPFWVVTVIGTSWSLQLLFPHDHVLPYEEAIKGLKFFPDMGRQKLKSGKVSIRQVASVFRFCLDTLSSYFPFSCFSYFLLCNSHPCLFCWFITGTLRRLLNFWSSSLLLFHLTAPPFSSYRILIILKRSRAKNF